MQAGRHTDALVDLSADGHHCWPAARYLTLCVGAILIESLLCLHASCISHATPGTVLGRGRIHSMRRFQLMSRAAQYHFLGLDSRRAVTDCGRIWRISNRPKCGETKWGHPYRISSPHLPQTPNIPGTVINCHNASSEFVASRDTSKILFRRADDVNCAPATYSPSRSIGPSSYHISVGHPQGTLVDPAVFDQ